MAPAKPVLHPLKTPKNMNFPSEMRERTYQTSCLDCRHNNGDAKQDEDEDTEMAITPPPAYTEFLNTFSPIFASPATSRANFSKYMLDRPRPSPTSEPSSAVTGTFPPASASSKHIPSAVAPYPSAQWSSKSPKHQRRSHLPPPYLYSPATATASPRSAYPVRSPLPFSPSEWRWKHVESPVSENGTFSIRQVVTTTITLKRAPQLDPPPPGKRRNLGHRNA